MAQTTVTTAAATGALTTDDAKAETVRIGTLWSGLGKATVAVALAIHNFLQRDGLISAGYASKAADGTLVAAADWALAKDANGHRTFGVLDAATQTFRPKGEAGKVTARKVSDPALIAIMDICRDGGEPVSEGQASNLRAYAGYVGAILGNLPAGANVKLASISDVVALWGTGEKSRSALVSAVSKEMAVAANVKKLSGADAAQAAADAVLASKVAVKTTARSVASPAPRPGGNAATVAAAASEAAVEAPTASVEAPAASTVWSAVSAAANVIAEAMSADDKLAVLRQGTTDADLVAALMSLRAAAGRALQLVAAQA